MGVPAVSGPADIRRLAARLRGLTRIAPAVAREAAPALTAELARTFDAGLTADGATRPKGRGGPVRLVKTGALRAALAFAAAGQTVRVSLPGYAAYQSRFGILPSESLPDTWTSVLARAAARAIGRALK